MIVDRYNYTENWSDDEKCWVGVCAEFPDLTFRHADRAEARKGIERLVAERVLDMMGQERQIPAPLPKSTPAALAIPSA